MKIYYRAAVVIFLYIFTCVTGNAQTTAPYIIFKTTYAFPGNPQKINEATVLVQDKEYTKGIYGSYGRGLSLSLGVGKMINPTFGFELNAEVLLGRKVKTSYSDDMDSITGSLSDKVRGLIFKPVIVIRNSGDLLSVYTKLGLAISTTTDRLGEADLRFVLAGQGDQILFESKETAKAKVGFTACFGLAFRVSESVSVFTEVNGQMLSLPITKGHYTKYIENGVNKLPSMKRNERSWEYKKAGFFDETSADNKPDQRLYDPANFSYIGIGVGIIYHF